MAKVKITDKRVLRNFLEKSSPLLLTISTIIIFIDIPDMYRIKTGIALLFLLGILYIVIWRWLSNLQDINLNIESSTVNIRVGDIFLQQGFKVIAFNEYFDTLVDDKVIATKSLNGIFIKDYLGISPAELDQYIQSYNFEKDDILDENVHRKSGNKIRYNIGTICVYKDYLLTAFSKFDNNNRANLTMPEYLEFLITFWDNVNKVYAQKSVATTIFGSGITRIKGHKNISDEDLLKIMLWTFRISEMRFKYPAKLSIVIHKDKINHINLLDIKSARNGI